MRPTALLRPPLLLAVPLCASMLASCKEPGPEPIPIFVDAHCEGTASVHCLLPWPSDRWLVADPSTATGFRLQYDPEAFPLNKDGEPFDVEPYALRDGFSPSATIMTSFGADVDTVATAGLAVEGSWELSTAAGSPSVLVDLATGELIPHMVEVDARAHEDDGDQLVPDPSLFYLRPAWRLEEDHDYGVAFRDLVLVDGSEPTVHGAFAALRDGTITDSEALEARRPGYDAMFAKLEDAGIERASLQQAFRFHTASGDNLRGDLLAMRDDAMARFPAGSGECVVNDVTEGFSEQTFRRIDGEFRIPLYMDSEDPPARAVRGPDGRPQYQGESWAPFTMLIPHSVAGEGDAPGRLLAFGHGLMGQARDEGGGGFLRGFGDEFQMVTVATDWQGMSDPDIAVVGHALSDVSDFAPVGDRLMQGVINNLVMIRSMLGACGELPEMQVGGHAAFAGDAAYWIGISQGGIMGGTVLGLSQDLDRGALLVGGMNYPLMIGRSVDFEGYELIYRTWYPERIDREVLMSVMISLWDQAEPNPWIPHLVADPAPGTPPKQVLYQIARYDSQVPNIASDIAVRTMGIPLMVPSTVEPWGIPGTEGPAPSAYVYYDFGIEPIPPGNDAPGEDNGVHGDQRYLDAARAQMNAFFQPDGEVENFCDGACDPE